MDLNTKQIMDFFKKSTQTADELTASGLSLIKKAASKLQKSNTIALAKSEANTIVIDSLKKENNKMHKLITSNNTIIDNISFITDIK